MKAYDSFDLWAKDQSAKNRTLIKALRSLVVNAAPNLLETVKWGNGCYVGHQPVVYIYAAKDYVQLGFFLGVGLVDKKGRLEGSGKYLRHIKVSGPGDIDRAYFSALVLDAVKKDATGDVPGVRKTAKKKKVVAKTAVAKKKSAGDAKGKAAGGEFPDSLSKPALRALENARIRGVRDLAKFSEKEILALHGMGPASIPKLKAALKKAGLGFRRELRLKKD